MQGLMDFLNEDTAEGTKIGVIVTPVDGPVKKKCFVWRGQDPPMMVQVPCDSVINPPDGEIE